MGFAEQQQFDDFLDQHVKKPPTVVHSTEKIKIVETKTKGRSVFAEKTLAKGERIFVEQPLCIVSTLQKTVNDPLAVDAAVETSIREAVLALTPEEQAAFQDLHSADSDSPNPYTRRFLTNALPCQGTDYAAVYRTACMINHSCEANAYASWDNESKSLSANAVHDIEKGAEITFDYVPCLLLAERRVKLKDQFNFRCVCPLCSLPVQKQRKSDARRTEFLKLSSTDRGSARVLKKPEGCMTECHRMLTLIEQEFARGSAYEVLAADVYDCAAGICQAHGDLARASVFKERETRARRIFNGLKDDTGAQQGKQEGSFGAAEQSSPLQPAPANVRGKWRSQVGDIPKGLNERKFNKWLWRGS